jgi:hypothetical protein
MTFSHWKLIFAIILKPVDAIGCHWTRYHVEILAQCLVGYDF